MRVFFKRFGQTRRAVLTLLLVVMPWTAAVAQTALDLDPFPRARAIIDSGAAQGRDLAIVPLSGVAPAGAQVLGRFINNAEEVTPWRPIAVAGDNGRWQAELGPLTRGAGWVRPQVRLDDPSAVVQTGQEVSAGHVVAIWGQSELHRAVLPAHAALVTAPKVKDAGALQVTYSRSAADDYGEPSRFVHSRISDTTRVSAHMTALSNMLASAAPGQRFHFIFHTRAGTGFQQLMSDADRGRVWADDVRLHRYANVPGVRPGLGWISWYNSDSGLGPRYGQVLYAALTGRNIDGSKVSRGSPPAGGQHPLDHNFADLYGPDMIWAVAGPHRFEMDRFDARIASNRAAVDAVFSTSEQWPTLRRALEPLTYLNGNPTWGGDFSHPDTVAQPQDGMTRLMLLMGNSILRQLRLVDWPLPAFDRAQLSADRTEVEVWSSQGDVTTTRAELDDLPDLPVAGFAIDGQTATNVTLRDGRVIVRNNTNGRTFPVGTRLTFGAGGIGTQNLQRDTRERQIWRDYPIVNLGQTGIEGIPVKAQTPQSVLGVFATVDKARDPLPPGNLLHRNISGFVATDQAPGWTGVGAGWVLDPATGTATADLATNDGLRAALPRGSMEGLRGRRLLLSFVPETSGSDEEILRIVVSATDGGATELFAGDVVLTPGQRMTLKLARYPRNRSGLTINLRRRGSPTGTLTLGSLGLYGTR